MELRKLRLPQYPDTPHSFFINTDSSVPFSAEGLCDNPDRGFRGECYVTLGSFRAYPDDKDSDAFAFLQEELARYPAQSVKILQVYVYLTEFYNKPLSDKARSQLTKYFEALKEKNIRVLLRFAYEYSSAVRKGPTDSTIISHCKQLKQWFCENEKLLDDTLYAIQLGMLGLWGEGHGSVHRHNITEIVNAVCDMAGEKYTVMVRYPRLFSKAPENLKYRLSLHDDFLVGIDHPWGLTVKFTSEYYEQSLRICRNTLCDGEMPWGRDLTVKDINPLLVTKQIVGYGLTSLSLRHNYNEDGKEYCLEKWKNEYLTKEYLEENRYPFAPFLLSEDKISVFDYYKYHLGYLLAVSNLKKAETGYSFLITNYGLNAPRCFSFFIVTAEGEKALDFSIDPLAQFGQKEFSVETGGNFLALKIRHKNCERFIKLANDIPFENGENIICR